nr:PREDICTED: lisH domain and HEAT repeat-containing protein KIAA1468 homolog [Bemisia tabaci]
MIDNPFVSDEERQTDASKLRDKNCSNFNYNDVAVKLLNDKLLLTALELHFELLENGREVPKLRDFFSNPGNFEQSPRTEQIFPIVRSSSQATLDSLDLTRFSEDGERGVADRVAVLEFELRKAHETINGLRNNLTVATECETPTHDQGDPSKDNWCEPIKPHEQRALNFLVNEYLLTHGYKLTSITFSDENDNQDFEDWDDVGLNIPKLPALLQLFRDVLRLGPGAYKSACLCDIACQTDQEEEDHPQCTSSEEGSIINSLSKQASSVIELKNDVLELERLRDGATSEPAEPDEIEILKSRIAELEKQNVDLENELKKVTQIEPVNSHFANSEHSTSPEKFEVIENSRQEEMKKPEFSQEKSVGDPPSLKTEVDTGGSESKDDGSSLTDNDWTRINDSELGSTVGNLQFEPEISELLSESTDNISNRHQSAAFQREVISKCFINVSKLHDAPPILQELLTEGISSDRLVHIVTVSILRIIPILPSTKREEIIPLLISAIHLHPEPSEREVLLQCIFNLKKRPNEDERKTILAGIVCLARCSNSAVVEGELLPFCWEQLTHRYTERRLLVAEACSALAPYLSPTMRNSLLLSMLTQMLQEDKEELVRASVVRSLALVVSVLRDMDKYLQCEQLAFLALKDLSQDVIDGATTILLPVLAKWALDTSILQSHLMTNLLKLLEQQIQTKDLDSGTVINKLLPSEVCCLSILYAIQTLLPYLVIFVASAPKVIEAIRPNLPLAESRAGFAELCHGLTNPATFYECENQSLGVIMSAFDYCVSEFNWPELDWILAVMVPKLLDMLENVKISQSDIVNGFISFFRSFTAGLGKNVALNKTKPIFKERIQKLEAALVNVTTDWPSMTVIPVYILAVLIPHKSEADEIKNILSKFLISLPLVNAPLDVLFFTVAQMSQTASAQDLLMSTLWEGVMHPRQAVRAASAKYFMCALPHVSQPLIVTRLVPALVTLSSDPETTVKMTAIPTLGALLNVSTKKEIQDKVYFQLKSLLGEPELKENHAMLLQLITTLGQVAPHSEQWFREEVIVPHLADFTAYTLQLASTTKRNDLTLALVEAFNTVVYCSLSKITVGSVLLPSLRNLDALCKDSYPVHHDNVLLMIKEAESRSDSSGKAAERSPSISLSSASTHVGQGVEEMKQKVSKIFNSPIGKTSNLSNLQNIFRKK